MILYSTGDAFENGCATMRSEIENALAELERKKAEFENDTKEAEDRFRAEMAKARLDFDREISSTRAELIEELRRLDS